MFSLEQYLSKYQPKKIQSNELLITCPICGREKLSVNTDKKLWHCWVCQEFGYNANGRKVPIKGAGNIIQLVMLLDRCTKKQALDLIGNDRDIINRSTVFFDSESILDLTDKEIPFPPYAKSIYGNLPYCEQRGISVRDIQVFGLFYCDAGRYKNRLIFPVWSNGKLVFYQGRAMWEPLPGDTFIKALNCPKIDGASGTESVLFNLDQAKVWPRVTITEGPIDAIHVGPQAVCTFGKHITDKQILKLYYSGVRAVDLMWDGPSSVEPKGAFPEMLKALPKLTGLFDTRVVFLPEGDPGQYSRIELQNFLRNGKKAEEVSALNIL